MSDMTLRTPPFERVEDPLSVALSAPFWVSVTAPAVHGAMRTAQVDDTSAVRNVRYDITYGVRNVTYDIDYVRAPQYLLRHNIYDNEGTEPAKPTAILPSSRGSSPCSRGGPV